MRFNRDEILKMDEAKLRIEVLKPLFERMGFRDVFHHHGGQGEKGKDFVMWKPGDLGQRVNHAVVGKAVRITGKADTRLGSAGEVLVQIGQAFGYRFLDPVTAEEQYVQWCWVVSSKEIIKEATESIKAALKPTNLDRNILFVDGERLWTLVEKYFPESALAEHLHCAGGMLDNLDTDWRVTASIVGDKTAFEVEPKHSEAGIKPLEFKFKYSFPNNETGQAKFDHMRAAIEKGTPGVIEKPFLTQAQIPAFIQSLIGEVEKVEFNLRPPTHIVPLCLRIESDDGTQFCRDDLVLRVERSGSKELLLSTRHQGVPWVFELLLDRSQNHATPYYEISIQRGNVHRLLQAAQLWQALARPGTVAVELAETGITLLKFRTESASSETKSLDAPLLSLLADLDFIQVRTGTAIQLNGEIITGEEISQIRGIAGWLRAGRHTTKGVKATANFSRLIAERLLQAAETKAGTPFTICGTNKVETILAQQVPLGPVALYFSSARVSSATLTNLGASLKNPEQTKFSVTFESVDNSAVDWFLLNSLNRDSELPPEVRRLLEENVPEQLLQMGQRKAK